MQDTRLLLDEPEIEADVVPHHRRVADERFQLVDDVAQFWRVARLRVADARQPGDKFWDVPAGVDDRCPLIFDAMPFEFHCPDLDDRVAFVA